MQRELLYSNVVIPEAIKIKHKAIIFLTLICLFKIKQSFFTDLVQLSTQLRLGLGGVYTPLPEYCHSWEQTHFSLDCTFGDC